MSRLRAAAILASATVAVTVAGLAPAQAHTRTAPARPASRISGDVVVQWNQALLRIVRTPGAQPATIHPTRAFAILQASVYDAVVSAEHHGRPYLFSVAAPRGTDPQAAAAQAGHDALVAQYPSFAATLDGQLATELAAIPDGKAKQDGIRVGQLSARFMVAARSDDGSDATPPVPSFANLQPGDYRPTPPKFANPVFTHWARVTPFLIDRADQFRSDPPPALGSPQYAAALNEVQSVGQDSSTTRTADQTVQARFWSGAIQNYWNEIAQTLVTRHHSDLFDTAGVFAELDLSLADGVIAFYDSKYTYDVWRPVTAIQLADTDGNPATTADPTWLPLLNTPLDPSYPGAHSVISAIGASILAAHFGDRQDLTVTSEVLPGVTRSFTRLSDVVTDAGTSRIFAGVHTRTDHTAGVRMGDRLAAFVLHQHAV